MKKNSGILTFFLSIFIFGFLIFKPAFSQDASLLPNAVQQFFDSNGNPLSSGKVYFYQVGTSTFKDVYNSSAATTPYANPITLNAGGKPPGSSGIYGIGLYRQLVKDKNGNTIWDAVTAPGGGGGGSPTGVGDGNAVGTVLPWSGLTAPNQYVFTYGQEVTRASYPELYSAITLQTNVICTSSSNTLTGIADTSQIPIGAPIELALCVPAGTTVISKTSGTVTLNNPANVSLNATARFFPYGNGNGSTTFNVPDFRGNTLAGRNNMGGTASSRITSTYYSTDPNSLGAVGGSQTHTQTISEMAAHNHNITVAATTQTASINGGSIGTSVRSNLNTTLDGGTTAFQTNTFSGSFQTGLTFQPHTHTASGSITGASVPFSIIQPTITVNYIIKVTPDTPMSTETVVTELGGMTGVISCGTGLTCANQTVSANSFGEATTAIKIPVKAATTANIGLFGSQTIDGVSVVAGDRVLVKDQSIASENGIYVVSNSNWNRATDFNEDGEVVQGTKIFITTGNVNSNQTYKVSTANPINVGSTNINFNIDTGSFINNFIGIAPYANWSNSVDSSAYFQNAINNATSGKYQLKLPSGTALITNPISSNSPLIVNGGGIGNGTSTGFASYGYGTTLDTNGLIGNLISSTNEIGSKFDGFNITNSNAVRRDGDGIALYGTGSVNNGQSSITNVSIGYQNNGIYINQPYFPIISDTFHVNWKNSAIKMDTSSSVEGNGGNILSNSFISGDTSGQSAVIDMNVGYYRILANMIYGSPIGIKHTSKDRDTGTMVIGFNTIDNFDAYGIQFSNQNLIEGAQATIFANDLLATNSDTGSTVKSMMQIDANSTSGSPWLKGALIATNNLRGQLTTTSGPGPGGVPSYINIDGTQTWSVLNNIISSMNGDTAVGINVGSDARGGLICNLNMVSEVGATVVKYSGTLTHTTICDWTGIPYSQLNAISPANGSQIWCTDCNVNSNQTIISGGTGIWAFRQNGTWVPFGYVNGIVPTSKGGTGQNWSASTGLPVLAAGTMNLATITSGGVPYGASSSSVAFTGTLAQNQIMIGGGIGNGPTTIAAGTTSTVLHGNASGAPSFGAVANADMATMNNNTIKSNISGGTTIPSDNSVTNVIDTLGSIRGSLLNRGAAGWAGLVPGTNGYPLISQGSGADPAYSQLNLASGATGTLPVGNGGTGVTSIGRSTTTPTPSCGSGTFTSSIDSFRMGNITFISGKVTITSIGSCTGPVTLTVPQASASLGYNSPLAAFNGDTGAPLNCYIISGSTTLGCYLPSGFGAPGTTGNTYQFSGQYYN